MLQAAEWSIDAGCWESIVAGVDLLTLGVSSVARSILLPFLLSLTNSIQNT